MAAAAVSAGDAACCARVPALPEALRDEERAAPALLELREDFLARAPARPEAVAALLSAGLVPLLLSLCAKPSPGPLLFTALRLATIVSTAARDHVGLAGFAQLLGVAERSVAVEDALFSTLANVSTAASVAAAVCGEEGLPTLRRLLTVIDRSPSLKAFGPLPNLAATAPNASLQAFFDCGVVTWLGNYMRRFIFFTPEPAVAVPILRLCRSLLRTPAHREAMQPLYIWFASALALLSTSLSMTDDLPKMAATASTCITKCALDAATPPLRDRDLAAFNAAGALASMARLAAWSPHPKSIDDAMSTARHLMRVICAPPAFVELLFPSLLDTFFTLPALCAVVRIHARKGAAG